jgi:crotonobetainyl-CoA:carnitine CoA-transferase CaiB-like acyl-CoA transferase
MPSAFTGIRILDFTRHQQGPSGTVLLADMGAEVIKVEQPGGEPGRGSGLGPDGFSAYFEAHNRGKKSIVLNMRKPEAIDIVKRLIPSCDVVTENYRPGVMKRWGLDYESLKAIRHDIILGSASAWGPEGPWANRPGFDHVAQALSGIMYEQGGGPDQEPHALFGGFADQVGGLTLAFGIASALYVREATGEGQHVDTSLIGSLTSIQAMPLVRYLRTGQQPGFQFRRAATYTHYPCADGKYIAIAANDQEMWERMCDAICPSWKADPRFVGPFDRAITKCPGRRLARYFCSGPATNGSAAGGPVCLTRRSWPTRASPNTRSSGPTATSRNRTSELGKMRAWPPVGMSGTGENPGGGPGWVRVRRSCSRRVTPEELEAQPGRRIQIT